VCRPPRSRLRGVSEYLEDFVARIDAPQDFSNTLPTSVMPQLLCRTIKYDILWQPWYHVNISLRPTAISNPTLLPYMASPSHRFSVNSAIQSYMAYSSATCSHLCHMYAYTLLCLSVSHPFCWNLRQLIQKSKVLSRSARRCSFMPGGSSGSSLVPGTIM
jgi:hypothetical protein